MEYDPKYDFIFCPCCDFPIDAECIKEGDCECPACHFKFKATPIPGPRPSLIARITEKFRHVDSTSLVFALTTCIACTPILDGYFKIPFLLGAVACIIGLAIKIASR